MVSSRSRVQAVLQLFTIYYVLSVKTSRANAFSPAVVVGSPSTTSSSGVAMKQHQKLYATKEENGEKGVEEYKNVATSILSNFMASNTADGADGTGMNGNDKNEDEDGNFLGIDFTVPKLDTTNISLETLAQMLDAELYEKEWFVTGKVNPIYFADEFEFQDPDVKLTGIEEYARGVNKLFDQETSRAEIISTLVSDTKPNTIRVTWRLSGKVNIGPKGLTIKPYICYTDFTVDMKNDNDDNEDNEEGGSKSSGLIVFQEDEFDIPQWDILLSALFPFLIGKITSKPAPPVPEREVPVMPRIEKNNKNGFQLDQLFSQFFK